jgi:hypothetical protein
MMTPKMVILLWKNPCLKTDTCRVLHTQMCQNWHMICSAAPGHPRQYVCSKLS